MWLKLPVWVKTRDQLLLSAAFVVGLYCFIVGNPRDQMTKCTEFLLFLALHQVGVFRISRFLPDGICSNKESTQKNQALSGGVNAILQSGLILKNIQRMLFFRIYVHCPSRPEWQQKHSSNVLENLTRSRHSAYTTRKRLIFRVLCALFEQSSFDMSRDIIKNPILCGAKNSNKLYWWHHLVTWILHTVFAHACLCRSQYLHK